MGRIKNYSAASRARQRARDPVGYRAHMNEMKRRHNKTAAKSIARWKKKNVRCKLNSLKAGARDRGIAFNLTDEDAIELIAGTCFYCGTDANGTRVNGIDRLDSALRAYERGKCVSCCSDCNMIKRCLDPVTFLERVMRICALKMGLEMDDGDFVDAWRDAEGSSYHDYKRRALNKGFKFDMTVQAFDHLVSQPCVFCHRKPLTQHSLDRIDNGPFYCVGCVQSCCVECNLMKNTMLDADFHAHCRKVFENVPNVMDLAIELGIPRCYHSIARKVSDGADVESDATPVTFAEVESGANTEISTGTVFVAESPTIVLFRTPAYDPNAGSIQDETRAQATDGDTEIDVDDSQAFPSLSSAGPGASTANTANEIKLRQVDASVAHGTRRAPRQNTPTLADQPILSASERKRMAKEARKASKKK